MKKLFAILAFFAMFPAFAQTYVMRVTNRIEGLVTYERYVLQGNTMRTYDDPTGTPLFSIEESADGRQAVMKSPYGGFISNTERAPRDLRPGEETFGTMTYRMPNMPRVPMSVHAKVSVRNGLKVMEITSSAKDIVVIGRTAYKTDPHDPEWGESIVLVGGKKVVDDYLTRLR